jgi:hypothetical protein
MVDGMADHSHAQTREDHEGERQMHGDDTGNSLGAIGAGGDGVRSHGAIMLP